MFSGILQLLDVLVYREVYESFHDSELNTTVHLRWIRRMEATFVSSPEALLQSVFLVQSNRRGSGFIISSLVLSVYSIASSITKDDEWKFGAESKFNKKCPPHNKFCSRWLFRIFEVFSRLTAMVMLWLGTHGA